MRRVLIAGLVMGTLVTALFLQAGTLDASPPAVTLAPDRSSVVYPAAVTLIAQVADVSALTTTVATLEVRPANETPLAWEPVGIPGGSAESTTGRFAFVIPPNKKTSAYRVRIGGLASGTTTVTVHVPMGKPVASARSVKAGRALALKGTIRPTHPIGSPPMTLYFQKYDSKSKKWKAAWTKSAQITTVIDNDMTQWSYRVVTKKSDVGSWRVRSFHQCVRHASSYSAWTTYSVTK